MASDFERVVDAVHAALEDPTLYKYVFRIAEAEHTPLRRIVWIPMSYDSVPGKRTNPLREKDGRFAKVLGHEHWNVEAHLSAESFEAVEAVRMKLLYVLDTLMGVDCVPAGGVWTTQDQTIAGVMWANAEKCVMRFVWTFNVVTYATPTTVKTIETSPTTATEIEPPFVMTAPP